MQDLELKRQVFELKLFEMNHTLNEKAEKSNKRVTMVMIAFAILEVVVGAASVMQLAYPNGWPWLMKLLGNIPPEPFVPRFPPM